MKQKPGGYYVVDDPDVLGGLLCINAQRNHILRGGDFYDFVEMAWPIVCQGEAYCYNWHVREISDYLQLLHYRTIRRLLINIPPGCMKSLLVEVFWPAWKWIVDPGNCQISASFDQSLTYRDAVRTANLVRSPWYQDRWGDLVTLPEHTAAGDYSNLQGGFRFSTSIRGKLTGRHCHDFVIDDPVKPLTISDATIEDCNRWYHETVPTRFRDIASSGMVLIMQRLDMRDLSAEVLKEGDWTHLRFPMYFERGEACAADHRTEEGELLWPGRFPGPELERMSRLQMSAMARAAQWQQRPATLGGNIFKSDWFKRYHVLPGRFQQMIQSWDMAFKGEEDSDFVCGQVWGRIGAEFWLVDQFCERTDFVGSCQAVKDMSRKWPKALAKLVEGKANGPAVVSALKRKLPGLD